MNIAIAADILELFDLLKEREVGHNFTLVTVVLILWSSSLVQVRSLNICCSLIPQESLNTATQNNKIGVAVIRLL